MSKHNKVDAFANFDNAIKEAFRYKKRAKRLRKKVIELQAQIKGLEGEKKNLKEILKPFAEFSTLIDITRNGTTITLQDFMRARQVPKGGK